MMSVLIAPVQAQVEEPAPALKLSAKPTELLGEALIIDVEALDASSKFGSSKSLKDTTLLQTQTSEAATSGFSVDPGSRNSVASGYHQYFIPSEGYASIHGFTGDVSNCVAGTVSDDFQEMTLARVNYYRAQAGLPSDIYFTTAKNAKAQRGAIIMAYLNDITHYPATDYPDNACVIADQASGGDGIEAASKSNLSLGSLGPRSVDGQMTDDGSNNAVVGHRRWILYSRAQEMGNGATPANGSYPYTLPGHPAIGCLWVIGDFKAAPTAQAVPWPNEGYIPWDLAPNDGETYPRWSYSYPGADFSGATVSMVQGGSAITLTQESVSTGAGDNTIVWRPAGIPDRAPASDTTYTISITGISDAPFSETSYDVTLIDPYTLSSLPNVSGSSVPIVGAANGYSFNLVDQAEAYEARITEVEDGTWAEGAEVSPSPAISDDTDDSYNLISSVYSATGSKAFHLATPDFGEDSFTIDRNLYPESGSEVEFKYRRFFMTPETKLYVELSDDEGASFASIYTLSGQSDGSSSDWDSRFITQRVSIPSEYLNKSVRLRFRISAEGSTFIGGDDTNGLHIDDISVTNSSELTSPLTIELADGVSSFSFTPDVSDQAYLLQVRPQLGGHWFGYGEALSVTSTSSSSDAAEVEVSGEGLNIVDGDSRPSTADGTDFGRLESGSGSLVHVFRVSNVGGSTLNLGAVVSSNSLFAVSNLSSSISAGDFDEFTVTFDPSSVGTQSATISFSTNDSDESPFNFDVSGEVTESGSDDHGNSTESATNIDLVSTTAGAIGIAGDEDYFRITIENSGEITVSTSSSIDTYGTIYDSLGDLLVGGDGGGSNANFSLSLRVSAGDYYIRVGGSNSSVTGQYVLETSFVADSPTWMPQGWVYYTWPYAYSLDEEVWHYFDTTNIQWRVDLSDGEWGTLSDATGWNYYEWPYSYAFDQGVWHWYNADTQWVVDLVSGVWARFGDLGD